MGSYIDALPDNTKTLLLMRDRDHALDRLQQQEQNAAVPVIRVALDEPDGRTDLQQRVAAGYIPLCAILPDGSVKYFVQPKHLDIAKKVAAPFLRPFETGKHQ